MSRKTYTVARIARELDVSTATVSRSLTGAAGVSKEVRQKVLDYCKEVGYDVGTTAGKPKLVAIILGDIRNPYYSELVFTMEKALSERNLITTVYNSEYDDEKELEMIRIAKRFEFAGLVLMTANTDEIAEALNSLNMPRVLVNRNIAKYNGDSVLVDNFQAGYESALHLIGLGHRNIGFIRGPVNSSASSARYRGYCQAMDNYGYSVREDWIWHSDLKMEDGRSAADEFLKAGERPTAVICANDTTALGFLDVCRRSGVRVPEDLSVASFDNINESGIAGIELTSMDLGAAEMGSIAARLLIKQIDGNTDKPERIILQPKLVVRKTTAAPAGG